MNSRDLFSFSSLHLTSQVQDFGDQNGLLNGFSDPSRHGPEGMMKRTKTWNVQEDKAYLFPEEGHLKNITALGYYPISATSDDVELVVSAGLVAARIQLFSSQTSAKRKAANSVQKQHLPDESPRKDSSKEKAADKHFSSQTSAKRKTANGVQKENLLNDPPKKDSSKEKASDKVSSQTSAKKKTVSIVLHENLPNDPPKDSSAENSKDKNSEV